MNWDYAAGFLDADGSLGFYSEYGSKRLCISASQITRQVLDELAILIGSGKVYERPSSRSGNMNTAKVLYLYRVTGFKLLPVLQELEPRLIVKKAICQEMIAYTLQRQNQPYHSNMGDRRKRGI